MSFWRPSTGFFSVQNWRHCGILKNVRTCNLEVRGRWGRGDLLTAAWAAVASGRPAPGRVGSRRGHSRAACGTFRPSRLISPLPLVMRHHLIVPEWIPLSLQPV